MAADEHQPLLPHGGASSWPGADSGAVAEDASKDIVDFDPAGSDPENPLDWPAAYKWGIVALLAFMAFTVTFTCISVVPVAGHIVADLDGGRGSKSASVLLVTIWELGEALGPFFIAPLSEAFGRYPVLNGANALFIAATLLAALSSSSSLFIGARWLTGLAVASNVLAPAIVGDIFPPEQRGTAMSLVNVAPLLGGAIGPAVAGFVADHLGWRAVLWIALVLAGVCEVVFLTCLRETYKVTILRRKAAALREETGNHSLRTEFDLDLGEDGDKGGRTWDYVMRPAVVLANSGVLQALALFGSLLFAHFYLLSTSLPEILLDRYHLSPTETGFAFVSFALGSIVSIVILNRSLDAIYIRLRDANGGKGRPEFRLPLVIIGGVLLPFTVIFYGWAAQFVLPVSTMLLSVAMMDAALTLAFLPLTAYVVDAFGVYSASAMTALIVTRCLVGTFLPLATAPLVNIMDWGWAFTVMASMLLILAPLPVLVMRYGHIWRQRSKYTRDE